MIEQKKQTNKQKQNGVVEAVYRISNVQFPHKK